MLEHPIEGLMKTTMDSLKELVNVNTIVGDPIETKEGNIIIPISKISIGFASGGAELRMEDKPAEEKNKYPFGGGSGAGVSVQPVAFLLVNQDQIRLLPVGHANSLERIVDGIPALVDEVVEMFRKGKNIDENIKKDVNCDIQ